jgi:hypothetical protein
MHKVHVVINGVPLIAIFICPFIISYNHLHLLSTSSGPVNLNAPWRWVLQQRKQTERDCMTTEQIFLGQYLLLDMIESKSLPGLSRFRQPGFLTTICYLVLIWIEIPFQVTGKNRIGFFSTLLYSRSVW